MSIKTRFNPMGSLGISYCTLTIVTSPSDATCVLTLNGTQYTTKSLRVRKGSSVSYQITYSNTTTKTGSVIVNSNKTLTFTRTYNTNTTEQAWTRPNLTSNGTMGASNFACTYGAGLSSSQQSSAYKIFDGNNSTGLTFNNKNGYFVKWYMPPGIHITSIGLISSDSYGYLGNGTSTTKSRIEYSKDNSNWSILTAVKTTAKNVTYFTVDVNTTTYPYFQLYGYYGFVFSNGQFRTNISEIYFAATKTVTTYTYYFSLSES